LPLPFLGVCLWLKEKTGNGQFRGRILQVYWVAFPLTNIRKHPTSNIIQSCGDPRLAHHWASFCDHSCNSSDPNNIYIPSSRHAPMTPRFQKESGGQSIDIFYYQTVSNYSTQPFRELFNILYIHYFFGGLNLKFILCVCVCVSWP